MTAAPLTIAHQGLAACLVQVSVEILDGREIEDAVRIIEDVLPLAHGDGPLAEQLVSAARIVLAAYPTRTKGDGLAWLRAHRAAGHAASAYYRQRAAACHDRIFARSET